MDITIVVFIQSTRIYIKKKKAPVSHWYPPNSTLSKYDYTYSKASSKKETHFQASTSTTVPDSDSDSDSESSHSASLEAVTAADPFSLSFYPSLSTQPAASTSSE